MSPQQTIVRRLIEEVLNGRDYAVLSEILDEGYVYRAPGEELHGAQALRALFSMYHDAFPDMVVHIDDMFGEGERVATAITLTGTHDGPLMGMPPTGRAISIQGMIHSRVRDGRILDEWEIVDLATMMQQLGAA